MCEHFGEDLILDYLLRELPGAATGGMDLHGDVCAAFKREVEEIGKLVTLTSAQEMEPAHDRVHDVISRIAANLNIR